MENLYKHLHNASLLADLICVWNSGVIKMQVHFGDIKARLFLNAALNDSLYHYFLISCSWSVIIRWLIFKFKLCIIVIAGFQDNFEIKYLSFRFGSLHCCQAPASGSTEYSHSALPPCDSPTAASVLAPVSASLRSISIPCTASTEIMKSYELEPPTDVKNSLLQCSHKMHNYPNGHAAVTFSSLQQWY